MSAIKKGDLVMIVRGHYCLMKYYGGHIFGVTGFLEGGPNERGYSCPTCGKSNVWPLELGAIGIDDKSAIPISCLRKIDPDQASDREREFDRLSRKEQHPLVVGDLDTQRRIMDESLAGSNNRS